MSPSARAMAAKFREVWIINLYAPSGTAMKQQRERFFNCELPFLLTGEMGHILLGGNFNCLLEASDTTGGFTYGRALAELVHGLALTELGRATTNAKFTPTIPRPEQSGLTEYSHTRTAPEETGCGGHCSTVY